MVNPNGKNLNIILITENTTIYNQMCFLVYYSVSYNCPDADFYIYFTETSFEWVNKLKIKIIKKIPEGKNIFLTPFIMMARELENLDYINENEFPDIDNLTTLAKEEKYMSFINYSELGKFKLKDYINTEESIFSEADKFMSNDMNFNEYKVFEFWKKAYEVYAAIN